MPSRVDLARWLGHAADEEVRLQGASNHLVSEAIYLADPEGNGIEVYADRPMSHWRDTAREIRMTTDPLDLGDLKNAASGKRWSGFPENGMIGHVHLQVGDTAEADGFYHDLLGFDVSARYPGASFYGSGGYHHQLAGNVWNSRQAGSRPDDMVGLEAVELIALDLSALKTIERDAEATGALIELNDRSLALRDPWGTRVVITV